MPSIMSQNLYQRVTSDVQIRKIEKIDPSKFSKSILQISDQQSRDKEYEKNIVYLRTYIASLQAKLNTVVEELNNSYDTMLNEMLYKKADSKDTAKLLNNLPNASSLDLCGGVGQKYDSQALEITPYKTNVKNYEYNTMFGSKALDLSNYYDYGQTNNTTVARSYYEKSDPKASTAAGYHELGTSVFGTLNYLWAWDLDRVNATYATTKDSYVDANGILHVPTGDDPRAGASGVVEDSKLDIANGNSTTGGNANNLQVNVTALQPNRGVFLPNTEKPNLETVILKENFEERNTGPSSLPNGWLSTYAQSMLGNTWSSYGLQNYDGINQWGVDSTPPVTNNSLEPYFGLNPTNLKDTTHPLSTPLPQPTYSTETAGYLSSSSANFGNIRNVTYDDIVYEPHSTYRFDPNLVREHFDKAKAQTLSGGAVIDVNNTNTATDGLNLTATGNTALLNTVSYQPGLLSGPNGNNSITTNTSPGSLPYQSPQVVSGTTPADPGYGNAFGTASAATDIPRNALDINYSNTPAGADSGLTVSTPKFDLSQFEDVVMNAKSYYEIESYIRKTFNQNSWTDSFLGIPYAWHWARTYSEYATPTAELKAIDTSIDPLTGTNTTFWKTNLPLEKYLGSLSASKDKNFLAVLLAIIVIVATGGAAAAFLVAGGLLLTFNPNSNDGRWDLIDFLMNNVPNNGSFFPPPNWTNNMFEYIGTSAAQGRANMGMDFTLTGQNAGEWVDYRRGLTGEYSKEINNANSTKWQLDDMNIKAKGYSRGEMISPKMDFSKMESGYLEFYDKIETKKTNVPAFDDFTKKQVYYSFDYDETQPNLATWSLLSSVSKTGTSNQGWELNSGEIPCAGGKDNVRVKFVFDTRNNVNVTSNASGTNIVEYSDFNGWNVDNIKLVGRKASPTDFYYYRQDLNSEFVTGAGAKLASLTTTDFSGFNATTANSNESLRIISESPLTTEAQTTFMNNAPVSAPLATPTPVRFNMSTIDTTTPTTPVAFSIDNTAINTNGSVTRTNSAPSGYKSISALSAIANTGDTTISVVNTAGLVGGSTFYINGTSYTVDSVVGTTTINFHKTLAPGGGLVAPTIGTNYPVGHMIMTPASLTPNPQTLTWDITNNTPSVAVPAGIAPSSFNFVATDIKIGGTSVTMDPWANTVYDPNNNPLVAPTPITMVLNSPANTTYTAGVTTPSSVKTITGINVPAGTANTTTITFDSSGEDVSASGNIRTISVYKPITTLSVATNGSTLINVASSTGLAVNSIIYINGVSYTVNGFESPFWWIGFTSTPSTQVYLTSAPPAGIGVATEVTGPVVTKTFVVNSTGASTAETIDISSLQGQSGLKAVITAASTNGLRSESSANTNINYWNLDNFKIGTKIAPVNKLGKHTSYFETEPYSITNANSTLNFEYAALDDPSGLVNVTSRKIYASTDGGTNWTEVFSMPDTTNGNYRNGSIDLSTIAPPTSELKLKFESTIDVPDQINIPARSDIFDVRNIKINHTLSDNYNVAESTAPANTNRPNISFDPRGYNVEGRYTDVNGRTQISNTDFPMFSNTILTAVESDASRLQAYRGDTYAEWVGLNTKTPARVLDMLTGKVKPQLTGNFVISKDGLNNYYDTTKSGVPTDMYVDDALAINTSKIIAKVPTLDEINQGTTGWVNAVINPTVPNGIWIPHIASTKYEETINSTYNNMTIWGKKTFLLDPLSALPLDPISTISANDDAYLYVNGFNVRSTAYAQVSDTITTPTSTTLTMIDATDYKAGEIVMINGLTGRVSSTTPPTATQITIEGIPTNGPLSLPNIGAFDDLTIGKTPYTVYHADPIKDASAVPLLITTVADAPAQANKLVLTSVDHLKAGQTIYVNGQALLIETVTSTQFPLSIPLTGLGYITFSPLLTNKVISGSLLAYSYTDAGAATNVAGSAVTSTGTTPATQGLTNSNSTAMSYHIKPLLRKGFNTVGVKATEDKGDDENFNVTFGNTLTAMGDTKSGTGGASGIDTDTTWALKVSPNGYDGSNPFYTGTAAGYTNDAASPLYQDEIDSLFKTEKVDKMETTVHFINQDPNGIGKLSLVKGIEVNVTGEPTVQTIKRNSFSTETRKDGGYVTTQLTKGFVNGLEQTGSGLALKFEPADMVGGSELNYMTDLSGKADINVFFDKKDSVVNDATMNVTVQYIEDSNGDGKITGAELTELKTRIIGMQDTRDNKTLNPNSDAPATNIAGLTAVTGLRERYAFVETIGTASTLNTISVANTKNFAVGDYIRIEDPAIGHQAVQITSLSTSSGAGTITFAPDLQFTPTFTVTTGPKVTSYRLLTDVDQAEASKLYLGSNYTTLTAANSPLTAAQTSLGYTKNTVTTNEQYLVASKGRSGGSIAAGNENKITARLKQILDGDEFQEMLKYGLLDGIYIAATASDNRGDQIVGKLMLDWDWRKKKILVKQGSFSAIYKS